ncbi:MAG TPA: hypothetical protein DD671_07735, partial [Balneolaceae bacterium]|nr:hypothetical protein [Balneolaceae bacterium]
MANNRDKLIGLMNKIRKYHDLNDRANIHKLIIGEENLPDDDALEDIDLIYDNIVQRSDALLPWASYAKEDGTAVSGYAINLNENLPDDTPDHIKNAFKYCGNWSGGRVKHADVPKLLNGGFLYNKAVSLHSIIYGVHTPDDLEKDQIDCKGPISKTNPVVNIVEAKAEWLQPGVTDTNLVKFFAQGIPTVEMSQAVPYFDLKIIDVTKDSVITRGNQSFAGEGMSVVKFIKGFGAINNVDKKLLEAQLPIDPIKNRNEKTKENDPSFTPSVAGMELFCLPQTYQGPSARYIDSNQAGLRDPNRKNSIIDPFRPLMTVQSFTYNVDTTYVTMPTIRGSLQIVLHDRSRLHEIAPLIRPDANGDQEFLIEFGWSHPNKDSVYGQFLNACRQTRKFIAYSSSYSFDTNGHVNIDLKLISKGGTTFANELASAAPGSGAVDIYRELESPLKVLKERLAKIENRDTLESLNQRFALGKFTQAGDTVTISQKDLDAIQASITKYKDAAPNASEALSDVLTAIDEATKKVESYRDKVDDAFEDFKTLVNAKITKNYDKDFYKDYREAHDPWAECWPEVLKDIGAAKGKSDVAGFSTDDHISVGRLLSIVCLPVLIKQKKWEAIDFVYYPCNKDSYGFSKFPTIASLPVKKAEFLKQFKLYRQTTAANPPLLSVVSFILKFVVDYKANDSGWGLGGALSATVDKNGKVRTKYGGNDKKVYTDRMTAAAMALYGEPRKVKAPSFKLDVETVAFKGDETKSILRISITDAAKDCYRTYTDLVRSITSDSVGIISAGIKESEREAGRSPTEITAVKNAINKLDSLQFIKKIGKVSTATDDNALLLNGDRYVVTAGAGQVKHFLSTIMPTFKFGTEFSIIKSVAVSSNTDAALGMINLKRSIQDADRPEGTDG